MNAKDSGKSGSNRVLDGWRRNGQEVPHRKQGDPADQGKSTGSQSVHSSDEVLVMSVIFP